VMNVTQLLCHIKRINRVLHLTILVLNMLDLLSINSRSHVDLLQVLHPAINPLMHSGRGTCSSWFILGHILIELLLDTAVDAVQVLVG